LSDPENATGNIREMISAGSTCVDFRPPTAREIEKRVRDFVWVLGVIAYLIFVFGGLAVFDHFVHDSVWRDIFLSVWWLPSGVVAFLVKVGIENHLVGWVPDLSQREDEE
jgi:hypothetical protein